MDSNKIFYATWGLVFILAGICAIFGMYLKLELLGIFMLWLLSVGIILVIVGGITIHKTGKTASIQIITGLILVVVSAGVLSVALELLNVYVTLALIIVVMGICILALALSKK